MSTLRFLLVTILFFSIVFPTALQLFKIALLFIVFILLGFLTLTERKHIVMWRGSMFCALFFSFIGLLWSLYGEVRGNPGAVRVLTVMAIYPLLLPALFVVLRPGDCNRLMSVFRWSTIGLIITQFLYLLSSFGLDGGFYYRLLGDLYGDVAVTDLGDDYLLFTLPSIASVIFMLPFFMLDYILSNKNKTLNASMIIAMCLITFLSGRRAIYLSLIMSFLFVIFILLFWKRVKFFDLICKFIPVTLLVLIFAILAKILGYFSLDMFVNDISSIFNFSTDDSNIERANQFEALMDGFYQNQFFGNGAGAAASYSRSAEQPWAYELFYVSILFQYGLLGFMFYFLGIMFLLYNLIYMALVEPCRDEGSRFLFCFLAGFVAFLISTATNPYLGKFDYMWVVFIPMAILNCRKQFGYV